MQRDKFGGTRGNGNTPVGTKITSRLQGPKKKNVFFFNHKNYNFLNCDWFKKLLFPTNSLSKLLSDSLLSDSLLSDSLLSDSSTNQSNSKL